MNNGIYTASSGLLARTQELDLAANNLANASTSGYRGERVSFRTQLVSATANTAARAVSSFGTLGTASIDLRQGSIAETGNPLDVALEGQGYFAVQTPTGVQYTRNGNFHVGADGSLVTAQGYAVVGDNGPIVLPPGTPSISTSGVISVNGAVAGTLKVSDFASDVPLTSVGNAYYTAPSSAATASKQVVVRQGSLENSNINAVESAVALIDLQRNAEMLQRAVSIFHSEFNKTAAEELPKV